MVCQVHFLPAVLNPSMSELVLLTILYPPLNFYASDRAVKVQIFKLGIPRCFTWVLNLRYRRWFGCLCECYVGDVSISRGLPWAGGATANRKLLQLFLTEMAQTAFCAILAGSEGFPELVMSLLGKNHQLLIVQLQTHVDSYFSMLCYKMASVRNNNLTN